MNVFKYTVEFQDGSELSLLFQEPVSPDELEHKIRKVCEEEPIKDVTLKQMVETDLDADLVKSPLWIDVFHS